jgi:hypothetical protein
VLPDGWGHNLDDIAITESNARRRLWNQDNDQIGLQQDATMTTMTMMKGVYDHDEEERSEGEKYGRRAEARRRDRNLPRIYVAWLSRLTTMTQHSCS